MTASRPTPATPVAAPPARDLAVGWQGLTLAGRLDTPGGDGPFPAIVMLQGSGPADRDSGGYFAPIRDRFLGEGLATFSFDKPGCGASTGDWRDHDLEDRVSQAATAVAALRGEKAIDPNRIGIWGHSQGGWVVQLMASRQPDLPFAVASSAPSITVPEQDLYGCEHTMRSAGHAATAIDAALDLLRAVHDAARRGVDYDTVRAELLEPVADEPWYGAYLTIDDAADWHHVRLLIGSGYEPRAAMARIRCPFLAVYGGNDLLLPAWRSAGDTGRALGEAGNDESAVFVFPGADHRIQDPATGGLAAGYLEVLGRWVAGRAT